MTIQFMGGTAPGKPAVSVQQPTAPPPGGIAVQNDPGSESAAPPSLSPDELSSLLSELEASFDTDELRNNLDQILLALKESPATADILRDADLMLLVSACGKAHDAVVARKQQRKTRTSRKKATVAEFEQAFSDLQF